MENKVKALRKSIEKGIIKGTIEFKTELEPAPLDKPALIELYRKLIVEKRKQQEQNRIQQRYLKKMMKCLSADADFELHIKGIEGKIKALEG